MELLITLVCGIITIPVAIKLNKRLHVVEPYLMPYAWGYYVGLSLMLSSTIWGIILFYEALTDAHDKGLAFILSLVFFCITYFGYQIIKRNKWGWIIGTIATLNPVMWVINSIYAKNRWLELNGAFSPISRLLIKAGPLISIFGMACLVMIFVAVLFNGSWPYFLYPVKSRFELGSHLLGPFWLPVLVGLFVGPGFIIKWLGNTIREKSEGVV